jgi:hypothetical protein
MGKWFAKTRFLTCSLEDQTLMVECVAALRGITVMEAWALLEYADNERAASTAPQDADADRDQT